MPYATRTDLETRYGQEELAQRETMLPAGAVDQALADADALIDGYLAGRYAVPLNPAPDNLVRIACQLARYGLLGDANTEQSRREYEDAVGWLKDVAAGRVVLTSAQSAASPNTGLTLATRTTAKQFDGVGLADY